MTRTIVDPSLRVFTARLPMPPSINATYRTTRTGGFFKTGAVKAWENDAPVRLRAQGWRRLPAGDYRMAVTVHLYLPHRRDIDGPLKVVIDTVSAELGINDSNILQLDVQKIEVRYRDEQRLEVEVRIWNNP